MGIIARTTRGNPVAESTLSRWMKIQEACGEFAAKRQALALARIRAALNLGLEIEVEVPSSCGHLGCGEAKIYPPTHRRGDLTEGGHYHLSVPMADNGDILADGWHGTPEDDVVTTQPRAWAAAVLGELLGDSGLAPHLSRWDRWSMGYAYRALSGEFTHPTLRADVPADKADPEGWAAFDAAEAAAEEEARLRDPLRGRLRDVVKEVVEKELGIELLDINLEERS